jgi:hypothetical protein
VKSASPLIRAEQAIDAVSILFLILGMALAVALSQIGA